MCPQTLHTDIKKLIGKRIRSLRKTKGWSQEFLAEHSDLSYKFIGEVERGVVNPSLETLVSIAGGLGVEVAELFSAGPHLVISEKEQKKAKAALIELEKILRTGS